MFLFAASNGESAKEVMLTLENAKCTCLHRSPMRHLGTRGQVAGKLAHKPNSHLPPPPRLFSLAVVLSSNLQMELLGFLDDINGEHPHRLVDYTKQKRFVIVHTR